MKECTISYANPESQLVVRGWGERNEFDSDALIAMHLEIVFEATEATIENASIARDGETLEITARLDTRIGLHQYAFGPGGEMIYQRGGNKK